ncbi:MAG: Zn-dependent protease [Verrucomicrobiales bacterium]|jgi:Zn-dependent protease
MDNRAKHPYLAAFMNLGAGSFFIGRWFGINVRIHFLLLFFAAWLIVDIVNSSKIGGLNALLIATVCVFGLFFSILLHEFGHSLACKLFKGDASEIILWPLGGLALCRPPFHPTAHLVTTIAGPAVTLVIWLTLSYGVLENASYEFLISPVGRVVRLIAWVNGFLLLFNCLPAFPMDGGRAIRDLLWHVIGHRKATIFAVWLGRITAGGMILYGLQGSGFMIVLIGAFILRSNWNIEEVIAIDNSGASGYSLKEHFKHAKRQMEFKKEMSDVSSSHLHECATCKRTELTDPRLEFRVSSVDDEEYCLEHLPKRPEAEG